MQGVVMGANFHLAQVATGSLSTGLVTAPAPCDSAA
jgi:hypothetical protein